MDTFSHILRQRFLSLKSYLILIREKVINLIEMVFKTIVKVLKVFNLQYIDQYLRDEYI
jgi:ATP/ADP translocase